LDYITCFVVWHDLNQDIGERRDLSEERLELAETFHNELLAFLEQANAETKLTDRGNADVAEEAGPRFAPIDHGQTGVRVSV
jgi:hypothetical protein